MSRRKPALKTGSALAEGTIFLFVGAVNARVVDAFSDIPMPLVSLIIESARVNHAIAVLMALIIVATPIVVFLAMFRSSMRQDLGGWFSAVSYTHLTLPTIYSV